MNCSAATKGVTRACSRPWRERNGSAALGQSSPAGRCPVALAGSDCLPAPTAPGRRDRHPAHRRPSWRHPPPARTHGGATSARAARDASELGAAVFAAQRDRLSELLAFDLDWQLAESLLQKADKMSMGASIELRTPLLDLEVAELAARIPSALKLPVGGPGKLILRKTLARKLNEPLTRPKKGFPVPLAEWFRRPAARGN